MDVPAIQFLIATEGKDSQEEGTGQTMLMYESVEQRIEAVSVYLREGCRRAEEMDHRPGSGEGVAITVRILSQLN